MKNTTTILNAVALCAALVLPALALAEGGHDHGAPAAGQGTASPRFDAHSELFELVAVLEQPGQLTIFLDRYASNEPIAGARIEFESGAEKGVAVAQPDGTYRAKLAALEKPGQVPFSFTVTAGPDTDLLAGELVIADAHHDDAPASTPWRRWAAFAAGALALAGAALFASKRIAARRGGIQA